DHEAPRRQAQDPRRRVERSGVQGDHDRGSGGARVRPRGPLHREAGPRSRELAHHGEDERAAAGRHRHPADRADIVARCPVALPGASPLSLSSVFAGALPLLAVLVFSGLGFGWRSWLQLRRYGSSGIVLFRSGRPGQHLREALFLVLAVALFAEAALAAVAPRRLPDLVPLAPAAAATLRVAGTVLVLGATALMLVAQLDLGASWRVGIEEGARPGLVTGDSCPAWDVSDRLGDSAAAPRSRAPRRRCGAPALLLALGCSRSRTGVIGHQEGGTRDRDRPVTAWTRRGHRAASGPLEVREGGLAMRTRSEVPCCHEASFASRSTPWGRKSTRGAPAIALH